MELYQSSVKFVEEPHQYWLDGKRLTGVTSLLHNMVFPDLYPDTIPPFVLARAAQLGHRMHADLQDYFLGNPIEEPTKELELYKELVPRYSFLQHQIASEYIVSDEKSVASAIDCIFQVGENSVILGDFKRTCILQVPYLQYQLSTYSVLMRLANPHVKVEKLVAIHLRQEKRKSIAEVVEIQPIDDSIIWQLLFAYQMGLEQFNRPEA